VVEYNKFCCVSTVFVYLYYIFIVKNVYLLNTIFRLFIPVVCVQS